MGIARPSTRQVSAVVLSLTVAVLWHVIWRWAYVAAPPQHVPRFVFADLMALAFAIVLVAHAPRGSGLTFGTLRGNWLRVGIVCVVPALIALAVYPLLSHRPWHRLPASIWAIQPIGQDLLFFGFIYRVFDGVFEGRVVPFLPIEKPLLASAVLFGIWHLPNLGWMAPADVAFQIVYTFSAACVIGLARQWTGSLLYGLATHMAVNFMAWSIP